MSTAVFYSLSTVCQYLTLYRLLVVSLCPLLSITVCPLSVSISHCTVCWLCHYVHCCLLQSVHCLSVFNTVPSVGCVTVSTAVYYSLSTVCQYFTLYRLLVVSLCPLLSSTVCPLSVNFSHGTVCLFCVTMSTAVFYSLSTVCQYLTLYRLLFVSLCPLLSSIVWPLSQFLTRYRLFVLCHYVHCCLLDSAHYLSVPHIVPFFLLLFPSAPELFYILSTVCQPLTLYRLFFLCHYVNCCLLHSVLCLLVPRTVPSVGSVSLCPLLSSSFCPLSASTSHCTVCWFCVSMSTALFFSLSSVS